MSLRLTDTEVSYRSVIVDDPDEGETRVTLTGYSRQGAVAVTCRSGGKARASRRVIITDSELVRDFALGESPVSWLRRALAAGHPVEDALAIIEQYLTQSP